MKLILFEWKKLLRTKLFPIFYILTIVFIAFLFSRNYLQQDLVKAKKIDYFSNIASEVYWINWADREILKQNDDPELKEKLEVGERLREQLRELIGHIDNNQWREELQKENEAYVSAEEYIVVYKEMIGLNLSDMELIKKLNNELLKRGLPKEDFDLSIQPSIFMKQVINLILNPFGYVILLFVLGTIITREFEEKNIKMVYALPIPRAKYVAIKFFTFLSAAFLWVATIFIVSYALPTIFGNAEGDVFNYPLYTENETFISTSEYLQQALLYSFSFTAFAVSVLVVFGFVLRNTILTFLCVLLVFSAGWFFTNNGLHVFANPFTYQMMDPAILKTPSYYPGGGIVLVISITILIFLTMVLNRKRGIRS